MLLLSIILALGQVPWVELEPALPSSPNSYEVEIFTTEEGLPQNQITALEASHDGRLWIATFNGIARFDGLRFEIFDVSRHRTLASNRILALHEDSQHALWVATEKGDIQRFDGEAFETLTFIGEVPPEFSIHGFLPLRDRGLHVITNHGLAKITANAWQIVIPFPKLWGVAEDDDGTLWLAHRTGLTTWRDGAIVETLESGPYIWVKRGPAGSILASRKDFMIERWEGRQRVQEVKLLNTECSNFLSDSAGTIWLGTPKPMIWREGEVERPFQLPKAFQGRNFRPMTIDAEGNVWLGGSPGLYRVRPTPLRGFPSNYLVRGSPRIVQSFPGTDVIYTAFWQGQLHRFENEKYVRIHGLQAHSLSPGPGGSILLAHQDHGVLAIYPDRHETLVENDRLWPGFRLAVLRDHSGAIWVSAGGDLQRVLGDEIQSWRCKDGLPGGQISALHEDSRGGMWVGTTHGFCRIVDDKVLDLWKNGDDLPNGEIRCFFETADGVIWVGTYGGGIYRVGTDGKVATIGPEQGLYEGVVSAIVEEKPGWLLLLGNRGVSRVELASLEAVALRDRCRVYPQLFKSAPEIEFLEGNGGAMSSACRGADGMIWFPTTEGLLRYDPAGSPRALTPPLVAISEVMVDQESYPVESVIEASAGRRDIAIAFSPRTFIDPRRVRYQYRLIGYEDEWREAQHGDLAMFTRVPPGEYQFELMAANRDGVWAEEPLRMKFVLEPYFYETEWFRAAIAIALGAFALYLVRLRTRRARQQATQLEHQVEQRTRELQETRDHLEETVAARTKDLATTLEQLRDDMERREALEEELRQAQRLESIGRLAGGIAHDFNNLLTIVIGNAQVARDELSQDDPSYQELIARLSEIEDASLRGGKLTHQLLAYSRRQVLKPATVDMNQSILDLRPLLDRLIAKRCRLELDLGDAPAFIRVDPGQLEQVIVNLVVNARDACREDGRVEIATHVSPADPRRAAPSYVVLVVRDNGVGIEEALIDRIFEPFFSTKYDQGTGLGLASVQGIVAQSGGRIQVESQPGEGTAFHIHFPAVAPEAEVESRSRGDHLPVDREHRATILVCDDEPLVGDVIATILRQEGHSVLVVQGPSEALLVSRETHEPIDLLICDLVMPGMNGRELSEELTQARPGLKVLFMSGYSHDVLDGEIASEAFLPKPITRAHLIAAVSRELEGHRSGPTVSEEAQPK